MAERVFGELRAPRQMLADQSYDGHASLHDDKVAGDLGFSGAPIEGPTHFSQLVPLLHEQFGDAWFERGCISAHYQNMVMEGEEGRAFIEAEDPALVRIGAEKADGTPVLTGTASLGPAYGETEIDSRLARLRPAEQLVLLRDLEVGQQGARNLERVSMGADQHMGNMYPFSLNDKLKVITEPHPYYSADNPWGRALIPLEMISVLANYTSHLSGFATRGPAIGLFAGQQIKLLKGPLFVDQPYRLTREIIALSESRRAASNWLLPRILEADSEDAVAELILNSPTLKDSYARYAEEARELGKSL